MKKNTQLALYGVGAVGAALGLTLLLTRRAAAAPATPRQIRLLPSSLVIGIPEDDSPCTSDPTLIWGAAVLQAFADSIGADRIEAQALPAILRQAILGQSPGIIYLYGHGNPTVYTCEDCLVFFLSDGLNLDLVAGKYVHLCSCDTAQDLGYKIVGAGAKGYFGYWDTFLCMGKVRPGSGRYVNAPFTCDIEIEVALLSGSTDLKAIYDRAVARLNDEIAYWQENWEKESCDGVKVVEVEAQMLISCLIHNREALRYYSA